jgi:HlyD family secretion protein
MNRNQKLIWLGAVTALVAVVFVFTWSRKSHDQNGEFAPKTQKVQVGDVVDLLRLRGTVISSKRVSVYSEADGQILKVHAEEGQMVQKGDLLLETDQAQLTKEIEKQRLLFDKSEVTYKNLQDDFKRKEALYQEQLISKTEFDNSQKELKLAGLDYEMAKTELAAMEKQLGNVRITSPIAGVITKKNVQEGEFVGKADDGSRKSLMTITDISEKGLEVFLNYAEREQIGLGQEISFWEDGDPSARFAGKITKIDAAAVRAEKANQFRVEIEIFDKDKQLDLTLGGNVNVEIVVREARGVWMVPAEAVFGEEGQHFVYVQKRSGHEKRPVRVGVTSAESAEIKEGLKEGELIYLEEPLAG